MKNIYFVLIICAWVFTGCAAPQHMYHWGNYSHSLYKYKKSPTDENLLLHKEALIKIIDESNKTSKRIPPGIYCEYGYILISEGKTDEALKYLELEEQTYPESKVFIQRLKATINKEREGRDEQE